MSGVEVRDATDEDRPAVFPFLARIVAEGETYAYPPGLSSDEARALRYEPPRASATASFMVGPALRGAGVGRALGEHALA